MITLLIELGMNAYQARSYHPRRLCRPLTPTQLRVIGNPSFSDSDQIPQPDLTTGRACLSLLMGLRELGRDPVHEGS